MKTGIQSLLGKLKNYNIYYYDNEVLEILEDGDSIYDLIFNIEIELYNDYITRELNEEWKNSIDKELFIMKKDKTRVYLTEFIPFVYVTDDEYRMIGDEKYLDKKWNFLD